MHRKRMRSAVSSMTVASSSTPASLSAAVVLDRNESRSRKSAQDAKWSFYLTAGTMGPELGEAMQRRAPRNHTPASKAKVALAAFKGDRTLGAGAVRHPPNLAAACLLLRPLSSRLAPCIEVYRPVDGNRV